MLGKKLGFIWHKLTRFLDLDQKERGMRERNLRDDERGSRKIINRGWIFKYIL